MSNEAARELGRKRWDGVSEEERAAHARMMNEAKNAGLSKKQISAKARAAAEARWGKPTNKVKKKKAGK